MSGLERPPRQRGDPLERPAGDFGDPLSRGPAIRFRDRSEAGRYLAFLLEDYRGRDDAVILGLPRGGVPVAYEVARHTGLPLDVFVVRKLGLPQQPELAIGAIASGGVRVLNKQTIEMLDLSPQTIEAVASAELAELQRREKAYRGTRGPLDLKDRSVILVDDGLATGATMRAAVRAARAGGAREVTVAVPVATPEACEDLRHEADRVVCATTPEPFYAVGLWYEDFSQLADDEVGETVDRAEHETAVRRG